MGVDPSSQTGSQDSGDDPSVTDVAGPSITRDRTPELERGMVLGARYQVEAVIGRGGSGVVLRAFDRTAQAVVAVKVLKPELVHDQRWSKRFSRELRLGRPIRHPNVCRIFDIGEGDGHRFLTMELATGGTLRDLIKKGEPLRPFSERLADAEAVIAGLAAIHDAGIVHRDVKPDNMLRMGDGRLALSDFGLATDLPTEAGVTVMVGTPHYMAPEVRGGEPATTRSDVWSLGVVLYEIFFGKRPERRSSLSSEGMSKPPAPLTSSRVERAMLALCERCLADNPTERPSDASAVAKLFEGARRAPGRFVHRRKVVIVGAAVVSLTLAAGLIVRARGRMRTMAAPPPSGQIVRTMDPTGQPADWRKSAKAIAALPGHVHCLAVLDSRTARVVWGRPRQAEDIDIESGVRTPSKLGPETFEVGCPQTSTHGHVLFTAPTPAGANEIRLSRRPDGAAAVSLTPGAEPLWMHNEEEFLYELDGSHPAVFSISTMTFSLLPDAGVEEQPMITEKAASPSTDRVAVLFMNEARQGVLAVYGANSSEHSAHFMVSPAWGVEFDDRTDDLWIPFNRSTTFSTMTALDWRTGAYRHIGAYPGLEVLRLQRAGRNLVLLGRQRSRDAWLYEKGRWQRLTSDGQNYRGSISKSGDLLLSKLSTEGVLAIWQQGKDGDARRLTEGPEDSFPEFSPDGRVWSYIDFARKRIMLCQTIGGACSVLVKADDMPIWLRFSPSGKWLAYVTQEKTSHLMVASVADGLTRPVAPAHWQCPPAWSSDATLWDVEGTPRRYLWVERDRASGQTTGRTVEFGAELENNAECESPAMTPGSPFFQRLQMRTNETSQLLRLGREELR